LRPKRWERAVGEEGQTGRRPLRRERAKPAKPNTPGVPARIHRKVGRRKGREGDFGERSSGVGFVGGRSPRGQKAQESRRPRPDLNRWGSRRGHGFFRGTKPLELRSQAGQVWEERARAESGRETYLRITGEEESFEGRSPRAWGAERGFHGSRQADTAERVAKP